MVAAPPRAAQPLRPLQARYRFAGAGDPYRGGDREAIV